MSNSAVTIHFRGVGSERRQLPAVPQPGCYLYAPGDCRRWWVVSAVAIRFARSYALEAERRMGEILAKTPRAKGGQPHQARRKSTGHVTLPVEPTLTDIGITKRESTQAQMLATRLARAREGQRCAVT